MQRQRLNNAFALGIKPAVKQELAEWCKENVFLPTSARSPYVDVMQTPWLVAPLEAALAPGSQEVVLVAPVGSGKSTMLTCLLHAIIALYPGPAQVSVMGDAEAQEFFNIQLLPSLKKNPHIAPLWPANRHAIAKGLINFAHMPLYISGSNKSAFQAKSLDYVILDEAWMLKKGLLNEARRRKHDRPFARTVFVSQAGDSTCDFNLAFDDCQQFEFCFTCSCGTTQPWRFEQLVYDAPQTDSGEYIWKDLVAYYSCSSCGQEYPDTSDSRRLLASSGRYVANPDSNAKEGHLGYVYNALAVWWIPWSRLVIEWITAQEQLKKGNVSLLKQFKNQRLSQAWVENENLDPVELNLSGYTLDNVPLLDETILTADVQGDHLWALCRTWSRAGESRLVYFSRLITFADLHALQNKFNIKPNRVFVDCAFRNQEVYAACAAYGWIGLNGLGDKDFLHPKTQHRLIHSPWKTVKVGPKTAYYCNFSSESAKDIVDILKRGHGARWELPSDISDQYMRQLQAETKKQTASGALKWTRGGEEHAFDLEAEQVVAAIILKCFPSVITTES